MIRAWFDGACGPINPGGYGGTGAIVKIDGQNVYSNSFYHGRRPDMTNNVAEYLGLLDVLNWLIANGKTEEAITVYGDSALVINQMSGRWRVRNHPRPYKPFALAALALLPLFWDIRFEWIPREENFEADALSKDAIPTDFAPTSVELTTTPAASGTLNCNAGTKHKRRAASVKGARTAKGVDVSTVRRPRVAATVSTTAEYRSLESLSGITA